MQKGGIEYILSSELKEYFKSNSRVYLCGNLKEPQDMSWIETDGLEIGMSDYKTFTADIPHYHASNIEYNFVLSGESKIFMLDEGKEYTFKENSLFVIPPNEKYASKHQAGTKILFIKTPGGNDKKIIEDISHNLEVWLKHWE